MLKIFSLATTGISIGGATLGTAAHFKNNHDTEESTPPQIPDLIKKQYSKTKHKRKKIEKITNYKDLKNQVSFDWDNDLKNDPKIDFLLLSPYKNKSLTGKATEYNIKIDGDKWVDLELHGCSHVPFFYTFDENPPNKEDLDFSRISPLENKQQTLPEYMIFSINQTKVEQSKNNCHIALHFYKNDLKANDLIDYFYENKKNLKNQEELKKENKQEKTGDFFKLEALVNNIICEPYFKIVEILSDKFDAKKAIESRKKIKVK